MKIFYLLFALLFVVVIAQENDGAVGIQADSSGIMWNLFNLVFSVGGAITTCFPFPRLIGPEKPVCAITTVATVSTSACLALKVYEGFFTNSALPKKIKTFMRQLGMKEIRREEGEREGEEEEKEGQMEIKMQEVEILGYEDGWNLWRQSEVYQSFTHMEISTDFRVGNITNMQGASRTNCCFYFNIDYPDNDLLSAFQQEICFTKFALKKFGNNRFVDLPGNAVLKSLRALRKMGWFTPLKDPLEFGRGLNALFSDYTEEFVSKLTSMIERVQKEDRAGEYAFSISDKFNNVSEQMMSVKLLKRKVK